ncbi:hypothetical protein HOS99_gp116 [Staphylococcus phage phiSA_BS1]|uniref:NUMOD4 domain-containing protein n=2 Tax=Baoshanvirus TaxID=2732969 RepID=A0A2P1MXQ0_9CAUD|nr:hypothetical protein HOS99_gp116 [Staphylococcus phage phiSA_BS1]YP_009800038.1 hypothetical protein HOT02_gp198 [Staphylococcus phage phiSA_BS2]AVP40357.1 hypothetical protein [Staphylococcus phage phiSA_BS1]AVR55642.1 hypothetical protein phiSABS2_198 [Staphylococcus phage phiSA_BS2]
MEIKIVENWRLTELKNEKKPKREYYISDKGRLLRKDIKEDGTVKRYIQFDPSMSKPSNKNNTIGHKTHINGKVIHVKKVVYCTFNNLPLDYHCKIKYKDGNRENINLENLYIQEKDPSKKIIDEDIMKAKPIIYFDNRRWIFMDVNKNENSLLDYYISDYGDVYNYNRKTRKGKYMKVRLDDNGYFRVGIDRKTYKVNRLVYCYFNKVPYTDERDVHHKNSITNDDRLENLEMLSRKEHKEKHKDLGTFYRLGKKIRKYSWGEVERIREMYEKEGLGIWDIAKIYNEKYGTVHQIVKYKTYKEK